VDQAIIRQESHPGGLPDIPAEQKGSLIFGITVHLGPVAAFIMLMQLADRSLVWLAPAMVCVSTVALIMILAAERSSPSVSLDSASSRDVIAGITQIVVSVGLGWIVVAAGPWFFRKLCPMPWQNDGWFVIVLAVPLTDLAYYWIHRTLNHGRGHHAIGRFYRQIHARHHSVTALDFFRGNISSIPDTAVTGFPIPLVFISTILGMTLTATLISYAMILLLQSTHHANCTFNIGPLRYLFVDNHAHKLHHCPGGVRVNHGAIVSIWDRLFGTYYEDWSVSASYMEKHAISLRMQRRAA
jgi:sterol desaturase/sphingolipid hydroxylase (fatty acid hydroxylase superfamily)